MSGLSFKGASNFTITDGNFGEIRGNVLTCNVIRPLENYDGNWPSPARSKGAAAYFGPSHRHGRRDRRFKSRHTATQTPFLLPSPDPINTSSPIPASRALISITAAPASPTVQQTAPTSSSSSEGSHLDDSKDGNGSDSSESSGYERYSTPPSDMDMEDSESGHQHSRPSDLPSSTSRPLPRQPNSPALLTPHSDTLSTRHPSPATRSQTLSANLRATLVQVEEVQPTCVDHNQGTGLPPAVAPRPRKARNFTQPLPHAFEPYPRQTPSSTTWNSHAYRPSTYRGSYIQRLPLNKWEGSSGAPRQLSRQNWMGGVCGYVYRCECGHPAMYLSGDPGWPGFPAFYEAFP